MSYTHSSKEKNLMGCMLKNLQNLNIYKQTNFSIKNNFQMNFPH